MPEPFEPPVKISDSMNRQAECSHRASREVLLDLTGGRVWGKVAMLSVKGEHSHETFDSSTTKSRFNATPARGGFTLQCDWNRDAGSLLTGRAGVFFSRFGMLRRIVVINGAGLGEQKLPRGSHGVPEIRARRTQEKHRDLAGSPAGRTLKKDAPGDRSPFTSRGGVKMQKQSHDRHCSNAEAARPRAYRMTAARNNGNLAAECGTQTDSLEDDVLLTHHFLDIGSGVFPAVVPESDNL